MTRKGCCAVIVLMKKRTAAVICGAIILAAAAAVYVCSVYRDKPAVSPEPVTAQVVLVIDAGHGGEDGGAVSASVVPESHINLAIAQKMQLLLAFVGRETIMTREGEEAIYSPDAQTLREKKVSDLSNRVKLVNDTAGSILLSIHQNSLPGSKVRGAQVFYNTVEPAQQMAVSVQQALNSAVNQGHGKNAKQMDDSIYLMKNIRRPGILVECGFLSNPAEAELLQTDDHQRRLSAAIVSGYLQSRTENRQ